MVFYLFQQVTCQRRVGGVEPASLNPLKGKRSLRHQSAPLIWATAPHFRQSPEALSALKKGKLRHTANKGELKFPLTASLLRRAGQHD